MKFSYTLGAMGAFALALTATAALACPPKPPTPPAPPVPPPCVQPCLPNPCSVNPCVPPPCTTVCGNFSYGAANAQWSQGGTNVIAAKTEADLMVSASHGALNSNSGVWTTQTMTAPAPGPMQQAGAANAGAAVSFNPMQFPTLGMAQFSGNSALAQISGAPSSTLFTNSMNHGEANAGQTQIKSNSDVTQNLLGSGAGVFNQQQANAVSGQAFGLFVPKVPTVADLPSNILLGNRIGVLQQMFNIAQTLTFF